MPTAVLHEPVTGAIRRTSCMICDSSRAPTLAHIEHDPKHAARVTVGNISAVNTYAMVKAADMPSFPMLASITSPCSAAERDKLGEGNS